MRIADCVIGTTTAPGMPCTIIGAATMAVATGA